MATVTIPDTVALFHERFLNVARYAHGSGRADPTRPTGRSQFNGAQELYLCELAQACHNLLSPGGVEHFFTEARRINKTWEAFRGDVVNGEAGHWFESISPVPEQ